LGVVLVVLGVVLVVLVVVALRLATDLGEVGLEEEGAAFFKLVAGAVSLVLVLLPGVAVEVEGAGDLTVDF